MDRPRIYKITFADVYPLYVVKIEIKSRSQSELDKVICWLTGYTKRDLDNQIERKIDLETFVNEAPKLNPSRKFITGVICGVRVEEIEDTTTREIRYMDKLVDELARGKAMEKILRSE